MQTIFFSFKIEVSMDQQESLLGEIRAWKEVFSVDRLSPDATDPNLLRMCYAYVVDKTKMQMILRRLRRQAEIEYADLPAERRLI